MSHAHHRPRVFRYKKRAVTTDDSLYSYWGDRKDSNPRCPWRTYPTTNYPRSDDSGEGYACSARQTHTTIVRPATSMLCAVRLPITKNKAHIVETGLIPRNDRTAASGPRPRYCHYSTQSLSCGATNVLQKCYEYATAFQLSTIIYPQSLCILRE